MDRMSFFFPWDAHVWWGFVPDPELIYQEHDDRFLTSMDITTMEDGVVKSLLHNGTLDERGTKNLLVTSFLLLLSLALSSVLLLLRWRQRTEEESEMEEYHLAQLPEEITPILRITKKDLECSDPNATPRLNSRVTFLDQTSQRKANTFFKRFDNIPLKKSLFEGNDDVSRSTVKAGTELSRAEEEALEGIGITSPFKRSTEKIFNMNRFIGYRDSNNGAPLSETRTFGEGDFTPFCNREIDGDSMDLLSASTDVSFDHSPSPIPDEAEPSALKGSKYSPRNSDKPSSVCNLINSATGVLPENIAKNIQKFLGTGDHQESPRRVRYVKPWYENTNGTAVLGSNDLKNTNP